MSGIAAQVAAPAVATGWQERRATSAVGGPTSRLESLLDPVFVAEAGWDPTTRVLFLPHDHPQLGWPACRSAGCLSPVTAGQPRCARCRAEIPAGEAAHHDRPAGPQARPCQVAACTRQRRWVTAPYCRPHRDRWRAYRTAQADPDEQRWRRTEPAIEDGGQVSLRGLPPLVVAQILYGLQQRTRHGTVTRPVLLRQVVVGLRRGQVSSIEDPAAQLATDPAKVVSSFVRHVRRAFLDPESERVKDVWDLTAFGWRGRLDFTTISQRWLREAAKRWAADDLPHRRGKDGAGPVRAYVASLAAWSQSLRAVRPDRGNNPAALGRADVEGFLHRLAYLESVGRLSNDARIRHCRQLRHVLGRMRALGLTRAGAPAGGLGEDVTLGRGDVPEAPVPAEPGRDLPAEVMRQLCAHLPVLEHDISCRELRVAIELIMDSGRRPDEVCRLPWDCLEHDNDGKPVLVYDNHKANRPGRRLPIGVGTAELVTAQKNRVRARFPDTPVAKLPLLPAAYANPHGRRAISENQLGQRHRTWIEQLPALLLADGTEFDKARVVPYAYRHTYAQRHADAGVPVDVLSQLMDHRSLDTTRQYYRVGHERRREAVDRVTAMQFDRHGNRTWRTAQALLDSEHTRRAVGEVAVPFGTCAEPSNVQAGGHACPYRFRCAGCDHFRTDVSYLPELHTYLDDLLRNRERLRAATDIDDWARAEATPSDDEITRIRRLINRIKVDLEQLAPAERAETDHAVEVVRGHRTVMLGMPRTHPTLSGTSTERTA